MARITLGVGLVLALGACGPGGGAPDGAAATADTGGTGSDAGPERDAGADASTDGAASADAGRPCAYGGGCDLLAQDCPAGQACVPGPGASECVPAGVAPAGTPCAEASSCAPRTVCVPDGASGTCRGLACAPSDCTVPAWVYVRLGDGSGAPLPNGVGICITEGMP